MASRAVHMAPPPKPHHSFPAHTLSRPAPTARTVPLCDQPNFRVDALHRAVFVFGLQTAEDFRAALDLLRQQCGEIVGAFRAADHALRPDCRIATAGCVVLCVIFAAATSVFAAQSLDGAVEVYHRRLVLTPAMRYRKTCGEEQSVSAIPLQHEMLWRMLFAETVAVDWAAASAAAARGEALRIGSSTLAGSKEMTKYTEGHGVARSIGEEGRVVMPSHTHTSTDLHSHTFASGSGRPPAEYNLPYENIMQETGTSTLGHTHTDLGRSNTLQQQYYSNKYNGVISPLSASHHSWWSTLKRLVLGTGPEPLHHETEETETESHIPPPLRRRVEGRGGHSVSYGHTRTSARESAATPVSASRIAPHVSFSTGGNTQTHGIDTNDRESASHVKDAVESVYIPRMRSAGDYFYAALPFASALLAPFCHMSIGPKWSSAHTPHTTHTEQLSQQNHRHRDQSEKRSENLQATHESSHTLRKRQREEDIYAPCGIGDGFASLTPDVLSTTFTVSATGHTKPLPRHGAEEFGKRTTKSSGALSASADSMCVDISAAASNDAVWQYMAKNIRLRTVSSARDTLDAAVNRDEDITYTGESQKQSGTAEPRKSILKSLVKSIWQRE